MKVSDLRQTLTSLAALLGASGAKNPAADLTAFAAALAAAIDDDTTTAELVRLLVAKKQAAAEKPKPGPKPPKPPKPKPEPKMDTAAAVGYVSDLYAAAGSETTPDRINGITARIKHLLKPDLIKVAAAIDFTNTGKLAKPAILAAIQARVDDRYQAAVRNRNIATGAAN